MVEIILTLVAVLFALYAYYLHTCVVMITKRVNQLERDLTEENVPAHMLGVEPQPTATTEEAVAVVLREAGITEAKAFGAAGLAIKHKWQLFDIQANIKMVRFMRATGSDISKVNIYYGGKGGRTNLYTVATVINHPYKGKTQLFRKDITVQELEAILNNPRVHTDKGYYTGKR